jgi:esterase/lipase superfamily enzyme
VLRNVQPVDGATFLNNLKTTIAASVCEVAHGSEIREIGGELFVFVHGFNVTFKDAARRTAQMAHDLEFPGAPVMFSWPSLGKGSPSGYREDERTAEWCEEDVMDFVTVVAKQSGARRVHLIAHSMGNRVLTGVLRRLAYSKRSGDMPKFNEVILTAPDIDAETFKLAIAPRITGIADRLSRSRHRLLFMLTARDSDRTAAI